MGAWLQLWEIWARAPTLTASVSGARDPARCVRRRLRNKGLWLGLLLTTAKKEKAHSAHRDPRLHCVE